MFNAAHECDAALAARDALAAASSCVAAAAPTQHRIIQTLLFRYSPLDATLANPRLHGRVFGIVWTIIVLLRVPVFALLLEAAKAPCGATAHGHANTKETEKERCH